MDRTVTNDDARIQQALRVANDPDASADRKAWASDAIAALEHGDLAAARRIGMDQPQTRKAA